MSTLLNDLFYAFRSLRKTPWLAATATLTLGLGLGAVGVILSVVKHVIYEPLPYEKSEDLVMLWTSWVEFDKTWFSEQEYRYFREQSKTLKDVALFARGNANLTENGEPERVGVGYITANLPAVLGVEPVLGRSFEWEEHQRGKRAVTLLSYDQWQQRYGRSSEILGSTIEVEGTKLTVVGIMPREFRLPIEFAANSPSQLFLPLSLDLSGAVAVPPNGGNHNYHAVARLGPGVTVEAVRNELRTLAGRLTAEGIYPTDWHFTVVAVRLIDDILGKAQGALRVLLATVFFVLFIAAINVALLLLARGNQRRSEMALRAALGARRGQLMKILVMESVILAALGCLVAFGLAYLGLGGVLQLVSANLPRASQLTLDGGVFLALAGLAFLVSILVGLLPGLHHSLVDPQEQLKQGGRSTPLGSGRRGAQTLLVMAEMALAVILVIGTGLMIRSFQNYLAVDVGFKKAGALAIELSPSQFNSGDGDQVAQYYAQLLQRLRAISLVEAAGAIRLLPMDSEMGDWGVEIRDYQRAPGERIRGEWQLMTPGYFEAMGIPLVKGRSFDDRDRIDTEPVIIINEAMAQKYWPGSDPVGREVRIPGVDEAPWSRVVGVAGNVRHNGLQSEIKSQWYLPQTQFHASMGFTTPDMTIVMRSQGNLGELVPPIRQAIHEFDPKLPIGRLQTVEDLMARSVSVPRISMTLMLICAAFAVLLAVVGTYGVLGNSVARRSHELAMRMALGAQPTEILWMVIRQGLKVAGLGILVGAVTGIVLARSLASLLYGIKTYDPLAVVGGIGLVVLFALLASLLPARRAASVSPVRALRSE